jgi:PAS domain-containing protein
MTGDEAAPQGDLLVLAVEGMERPLFVLDADWRFRYINPAGARVLDRTVENTVGRDIWEEFPEALGSPFEELYRRVRPRSC